MKKSFKILIIIFFVFLFDLEYSGAKNRFNVFTYTDYTDISNLQTFYRQLDEFGASVFLTYHPDSAAKYVVSDSLNLSLVNLHWSDPYRIYINSANTIDLYNGAVWATIGRMNGANDNAVLGYLLDNTNPQYIGRPMYDGSIMRRVLVARHGEASPGLLHPNFREGIFNVLNKGKGVEAVTFEAWLRIGDISGDDTITVAQMIFEDERARWDCENDTTSPFMAIRYNDTLLIVGTSHGLDTVETIDRTDAGRKVMALPRCNCLSSCRENVATDTAWGLRNIGYRDEDSNIIYVLPYKFIKDIKVRDFTDTITYKSISYSVITRHSWEWDNYKIYYTGAKTLYLDSFSVYDNLGKNYDAIANNPDSLSIATMRIRQYYDNRPYEKDAIKGLYIMDEPYGTSVQVCGTVKKIMNTLGTGYPDSYYTTLGAYNNIVPGQTGSQYFDTYIKYSDENFFLYDYYPNLCYTTPSSDAHDSTSVQWVIDHQYSAKKQGIVGTLKTAKARCDAISPKPNFWVVFPSFAEYDITSDSLWIKSHRQWTPEEMKMATNLALLYGAKGIGYWLYFGRNGCEYEPPYTCDTLPKTRSIEEMLSASMEYDVDIEATENAYRQISACSCKVNPPYVFQGLIDRDMGNNAVPIPLWYDVKEINQYLDSMAYFFLNATWLSAGRWTEDIGSLSGSFIDSVQSLASYDSAYIQLGFFEKDGDDYSYILNRRCDNGDYGRVDSQTVRIYFRQHAGLFEVTEMYTGRVDTIWDSCGISKFDMYLAPGEAKLIRKRTICESWSGHLSRDWTWPNFATINIIGDITVDSGKTLAIMKPTVNIPFCGDVTQGGADSSKTEIIVKGNLNITGSSDSRVILSSPGSGVGWRGIRTLNQGSLSISYADIKNAYYGIDKSTNYYDDIIDVNFLNCGHFGVFCHGNNMHLLGCVFDSIVDTNGIGLDLQSAYSISVQDCHWQHIRQAVLCQYSNVQFSNCGLSFDSPTGESYGMCLAHSTMYMGNSSIANFQNGIVSAFSNVININTSKIYCDPPDLITADSSNGLVCLIGAAGSVKVRNSCFYGMNQAAVISYGPIVDLGTDSDPGHNGFYESLVAALTYFPLYFVANIADSQTPLLEKARMFKLETNNDIKAKLNQWSLSDDRTYTDQYPFEWQLTGKMKGAVSYSSGIAYQDCEPVGGINKGQSQVAETESLPKEFSIKQNYPNPFNPATVIDYELPKTALVELSIYNILGHKIKTLNHGTKSAGRYSITWDGTDDFGRRLPSGVYFYRLKAGDFESVKKMMILK